MQHCSAGSPGPVLSSWARGRRPSANHVLLSPQHCRERPRSMVVIEVFTPVVQRILKHNMVSLPAPTTEPGVGTPSRPFTFTKILGWDWPP